MFSILIYNVLSGFRGTVQTDFAPMAHHVFHDSSRWNICPGSMALMVVRYGAIFNTRSAGFFTALLNPDRQGFGLYLSFLGSNFIFWGLWWPGAMDQWQRCAAARTTRLSLNREWGTIGIVAIVYFGILTFVFLMAGVWLRVAMPNAQPNPAFLRTLIVDVQQWAFSSLGPSAGVLFAGLVFLGLICAAMSTIDSYVMTASQTFFVDTVHARSSTTLVELDKSDQDKKLLMQARAFTIFIPLLVTILALLFSLASDVYALIYWSFSFMFALLPSLYVGLRGWARSDARGACERSLLAGGITSCLFVVIIVGLERAIRKNGDPSWWYQAMYWWSAVIAAVGAFVLWVNWPKKQHEG